MNPPFSEEAPFIVKVGIEFINGSYILLLLLYKKLMIFEKQILTYLKPCISQDIMLFQILRLEKIEIH